MTRRLFVATTVGCGLLLAAAAPALAQEGPGRGFRGHGRGRHWIGAAIIVAALAAVIALTWFLARHRSTSAAPATPVPTSSVPAAPPSPTAVAEAILAERLARGEIGPDDYRAALSALRPDLVTTR
jgi:uncharacterized membrane protein